MEEQFYLIWPVLLVVLWRWRHAPLGALVLICVASFSLNFFGSRSAIYYLLPFRAFELGIGALCVWFIRSVPRTAPGTEISVAAGLAMIGYSVFTYDTRIVFPSYNSLLPCIGTALVIYGGQARWAGRLLNNAAAVFLGRISYSLYLVHWPVIVFIRYMTDEHLVLGEQVSIGIISVALATLMYMFVEQPFRHQNTRRLGPAGFGLACSMCAMLLLLPSASSWATGWFWRYPDDVARQLRRDSRTQDAYVWENHLSLARRPFPEGSGTNILVIGDSMGGDLVNVLLAGEFVSRQRLRTLPVDYRCGPILPEDTEIFVRYSGEVASKCIETVDQNRGSQLLSDADTVILAGTWVDWTIDHLEETVRTIRSLGEKEVVVWGPKKQSIDGLQFLAQNFRTDLPRKVIPADTDNLRRIDKLHEITNRLGISFIDTSAVFCSRITCRLTDSTGQLLIYDRSHLTPAGVRFLANEGRQAIERVFRDSGS